MRRRLQLHRNGWRIANARRWFSRHVNKFEECIHIARRDLEMIGQVLSDTNAKSQLKRQQKLANDPNLWSTPTQANRILQTLAVMEGRYNKYDDLKHSIDECQEFYGTVRWLGRTISILYAHVTGMAQMEGDQECQAECVLQATELVKRISKLRVDILLSQPMDECACFIEIQAGAGGTDSCDWVEMLLRMYLRWAESRKFESEIVAQSAGEEAGLRSVMVRMTGAYTYGWVKSEAGVHRVVRISPFDGQVGKNHLTDERYIVFHGFSGKTAYIICSGPRVPNTRWLRYVDAQ